MHNIVTPDFNEYQKMAIELIAYLRDEGVPIHSIKYLKSFKIALECIINNNTTEGDIDEKEINGAFIIGFHNYENEIQYIAALRDDATVAVYTNTPLYKFTNEIEQGKNLMEIIYTVNNNAPDTKYVNMSDDDPDAVFSFMDFITKLDEVVQSILDKIPPILLNNY